MNIMMFLFSYCMTSQREIKNGRRLLLQVSLISLRCSGAVGLLIKYSYESLRRIFYLSTRNSLDVSV